MTRLDGVCMKTVYLLSILLTNALSSFVNATTWSCKNEKFESRCDKGSCSVESKVGSFTALGVTFSDEGEMSICVYSGCWEGKGEVLANSPYLVLLGAALPWSNPKSDDKQEVLIGLDIQNKTATVQVLNFVQPLVCEQS